MHTKLQLLEGQIPLNLLAIAEFLGIEYEIDTKEYNKNASKHYNAAQVFLRNKSDENVKIIDGVKPGLYRLGGSNQIYTWQKGSPRIRPNIISLDERTDNKVLVHVGDEYAIDQKIENGLLILCTKEGKIITSNSEVARIQTTQTLHDILGDIKTWIQEIVTALNKNIILQEKPHD
jgi:hypothetical protein